MKSTVYRLILINQAEGEEAVSASPSPRRPLQVSGKPKPRVSINSPYFNVLSADVLCVMTDKGGRTEDVICPTAPPTEEIPEPGWAGPRDPAPLTDPGWAGPGDAGWALQESQIPSTLRHVVQGPQLRGDVIHSISFVLLLTKSMSAID